MTVVELRPKRERCSTDIRRRAILDAAREIFLERGYAGASVDAVVERAGGSKATVYAMFGNKEGLMTALIADGAEALAASADAIPPDAPLEQSLREFGLAFLKLVLDPVRLALYRFVVGEAVRFPELGDAFYRTAPATLNAHFAEYFRTLAARGVIATSDPSRLAGYFFGALRADLHVHALCNPAYRPSAAEMDAHVDFVVTQFMKQI